MADIHLHQTQSLQQSIAPQMQQSLQVLQAATLELRQLVQQELVENPVLEDETTEISLDEKALDPDDKFEDEFNELSQLDDEWREYMAQSRSLAPRREEDDERRRFLFDSLVTPVTLQEHLLEQLSTEDIDADQRELAELVIGNIDDRGFLQTPLEELAMSLNRPLGDLRQAKELVQSFHPVGVGAEDLRECLLIQLERLDQQRSLAYRVVRHHLDELARRRFQVIARKLGVPPEQVARAADFIATLDPRPGQRFAALNNQFVNPDIMVEREGGDFVINLNDEQIPRLRISNTYKSLMTERGSDASVRSYIREKIRSGKFLIKSIHQRQETIRRIAGEIVSRQRGFMDKGPAHLKPMNMAQIADAVGVHETTVSRAIAGKYMATPHGVFEMKYFFKPGYRTAGGQDMSNTSVKNTIAELVRNEPPAKPLSDQQIVEELAGRGIPIARRTVAKYRDELNILPSNLRRSY